MSDLTSFLLPRLRAHRLPGLDLGGEFVYPKYADQSILNLPGSVCRWLGIPDFGAPALIPEILGPLGENAQRVILILMDALALHRLQRWMADGTAPIWGRLAEEGLLAPLTSITPSTTSAALTSLWTGRSAAEHGVAGYELWLKEYGVVTNMIAHAPINFQGDMGSLSKAGFRPETFLPFKTFGTHLAEQGVQPYAFQHHTILRSGLSQMFFRDVDTQPVGTPADLWVNVRQLIESRPHERQYIWVYWGEVDHLSHFYGPDDERVAAEFHAFSEAMLYSFINRLSPAARRGTILLLTADHGQIHTHKSPRYEVSNHPELVQQLPLMPTGENRLMYLFQRPGRPNGVRDYFESTWPGEFAALEPALAVEKGLFGPGQPHEHLFDRLGDWVMAARSDAYLWWADKENRLVGRHGGLSPEEMLVPLLGVRW